MIRKPRTTSAGVGLLIAVALVSGCQPKVGTAAQVGDTRITTDQLNAATDAAAPSTAAGASAAPASAPAQDSTLTALIRHQLLLDLAKQRGVVVSQGAIDAVSSGSTGADRIAAESQAAFVALARDYAKTGHAPDSVEVVAIPVADQATAQKAVDAVNAAPDDAIAIGKKYGTNSALQETLVSLQTYPELAGIGEGQTKAVTIQGQLYVAHVNQVLSTSALQKDLQTVSKVSVNPRFGSWDPKTIAVGPFVSDVVSPAPVAPSAAPSGAVPSAAAPSAAAPSS